MPLEIHAAEQDAHDPDSVISDPVEHEMRADRIFAESGRVADRRPKLPSIAEFAGLRSRLGRRPISRRCSPKFRDIALSTRPQHVARRRAGAFCPRLRARNLSKSKGVARHWLPLRRAPPSMRRVWPPALRAIAGRRERHHWLRHSGLLQPWLQLAGQMIAHRKEIILGHQLTIEAEHTKKW